MSVYSWKRVSSSYYAHLTDGEKTLCKEQFEGEWYHAFKEDMACATCFNSVPNGFRDDLNTYDFILEIEDVDLFRK